MISVFFSLGIRTPFKLSPQPNESPAKRVSFGEETQRNECALPLAAGQMIWSLCRRRGWGRGRAPKLRPAYSRTRCLPSPSPSSEATAHPSLPTEVESSLAPCFLLSPAKPLRWVSPGARSGRGIPIGGAECVAPQVLADRVDSADFVGGLIIGTIGTLEVDDPPPVAAANGGCDARFP